MNIPKSPKVDESPIIMLDRGNCTFVQKARNAQNAGAHLVIIVNNDKNQDVRRIVMADDGTGEGITIPVILINLVDGNKIKNFYFLNRDKPDILNSISLELNFEIEKSNTVSYTLWYSPEQVQIYNLISDLYSYFKLMGDLTKLNIHFAFFVSSDYRPGVEREFNHCLGSGKYCALPNSRQNINDGRLILKEMINQKCIYQITYQNGNSNMFWEYLNEFYQQCILKNTFNPICALSAMETVGIPTEEVSQCKYNSYFGGKSKDKPNYELLVYNKILDGELEARKEHFVLKLPTLFINDRQYLGALRADFIFDAICASFVQKPEMCIGETGYNKDKTSVVKIIFVVIGIIIANVIIFIVCSRIIKKKIKDRIDNSAIESKIDSVVSSYLKMREDTTSSQ